MDLNLEKKVIMLAGSSKGLGYAIAQACAQEGARVSLASRTAEDIEKAARRIQQDTAQQARGYPVDVRDAEQIQQWVKNTLEHFGRIDGLVLNAGGPPMGSFESFDDAAWQQGFELTVLSAIRLLREVLPHMKERRSGAILAITSSSIREPIPSLILSNVLRSSVASLIKSLATELGEFGIRVNNLVPGRIDTDRVTSLDQGLAEKLARTSAEVRKGFEAEIPLGRYGMPEEFGRAGAFLLSDAATYISGTTLLVDGGKAKSIW